MTNIQSCTLQGQLSRIQIEEGLDTEEGVGFDRIGHFNENHDYKHNFISHLLLRRTIYFGRCDKHKNSLLGRRHFRKIHWIQWVRLWIQDNKVLITVIISFKADQNVQQQMIDSLKVERHWIRVTLWAQRRTCRYGGSKCLDVVVVLVVLLCFGGGMVKLAAKGEIVFSFQRQLPN